MLIWVCTRVSTGHKYRCKKYACEHVRTRARGSTRMQGSCMPPWSGILTGSPHLRVLARLVRHRWGGCGWPLDPGAHCLPPHVWLNGPQGLPPALSAPSGPSCGSLDLSIACHSPSPPPACENCSLTPTHPTVWNK